MAQYYSDDPLQREIVCPTAEPETVIFEAESVEGDESFIRAQGRVFLQRGDYRLRASSVSYNRLQQQGTLRDAMFTTCDKPSPDYRLQAREIDLLPNYKIRAKGVSLYLGSFKVFSLPSIKLRVGGRGRKTPIFPAISYDSIEGASLAQELILSDTDRTRIDLEARITSEMELRGRLALVRGLDGKLDGMPGRQFTYDSMRESVLDVPVPVDEPCAPGALLPPEPGRLRAFGHLSLRERTFDIANEDLTLSKIPEVGLQYVGRQIYLHGHRLDPRLEIYPRYRLVAGYYEEDPDSEFTGRLALEALVPVSAFSMGPRVSVQPALLAGVNTYDTGDDYRSWAYAMDVSALLGGGSLVSMRYIQWHDSGRTPLRFDNIDVTQEVQAGIQFISRRHIGGLVVNYDLDRNELYEYELLYGLRTDCLQGVLSWNSRLSRISLHFDIISL